MERRKFLIGLGSAAAGSAAVLGTGAGNVATVKDRKATVDVTEDYNAWLDLRPADGTNPPENIFASNTGQKNKLVLDFGDTGSNTFGQGPNTDAIWKIPNVFHVSNEYVRDLDIWVSIDNFPNGSPVWAYYTDNDSNGTEPEDPVANRSNASNKKTLPVGYSQNFGVYIDTTNVNLGDKNLTFTIQADQA